MLTQIQKQLIEDCQITFATPHGKRVYEAIRKWSGYEDRIVPTGTPGIVEFELGKRELFLYIKDKVEADLNRLMEDDQVARTTPGPNVEGQQQTQALGGTEEDAGIE